MSTFNGVVEEFPYIRIDNFRRNPERPAPLACFLSHVHSDHLTGLESLRAPFVYCSRATREILLRIERYPHRMNFSKGILESRKQHYKHLARLLRPIPLQTPTEIELMPGNSIRVTLFDANHCPGSVMFLIEGGGKAILYTGDIRAETWWVQSLVRNPVLIPYTMGDNRLDNIYLDTTFATKSHQVFPSKAEGIQELLSKIKEYPDDTLFYLRSWTFGYEDVWLALSTALNTKIHVDRYQFGLYKSLAARLGNGFGFDDSLYLCGFPLGNSLVPGCLTQDQSARVHSCEPGVMCPRMSSSKAVYITPIVTRTEKGLEIPELGAGGGKGDLEQSHDLELPDDASFQLLLNLCEEQIKEPRVKDMVISALTKSYRAIGNAIPLDEYGIRDEEEIPLANLASIISNKVQETTEQSLPNTIRFPYSRHSCYSELCELVGAFSPRDVYPCTVDSSTWREEVSIQSLFGHLCSGTVFRHDLTMREDVGYRPLKRQRRASDVPSETTSTQVSPGLHCEADSLLETSITPHHVQNHDEYPPHIAEQPEHNSLVDYPSSFPTQLSTRSSESPTTRFRAIKQAMQANFSTDDISLYLPSFPTNTQPDAEPPYLHSGPSQSQEALELEQREIDLQLSLCVSHVPTTDGSGDVEREEDEEVRETESETESALSLPSSAFQSQLEQKLAREPKKQTGDLVLVPSSAPGPESDRESEQKASSSDESSRVRKILRKAAYRAARKGTYEAWASECSLISVWDNHTHTELEL